MYQKVKEYINVIALQLTTPFHGMPTGTGETYTTKTFIGVDGTELSSKTYVSTIINGRGRYKNDEMFPLSEFKVKQGQTHHFRIIHSGAEYAYEVKVDNHSLLIDSSDGVAMKPIVVDSLIIFPGERTDVDICANQSIGRYLIRLEILGHGSGNYTVRDGLVFGGQSLLVYETSDEMITGEKR